MRKCLRIFIAVAIIFLPEIGVASEKEIVISMQDINCQSCGAGVKNVLLQKEGVKKVSFHKDKAELTIRYDSKKIQVDSFLEYIQEAGFTATVGAGKGSYAPHLEFPKNVDMKWISRAGEDVDIKKHLVAGKVTVIDFFARWCGPCREVDTEMLSILKKDKGVALRKINVVNWDTPIAKRYLKRVPNLPYVVIFSKQGKLVEKISGLKLKELRRAIAKGAL